MVIFLFRFSHMLINNIKTPLKFTLWSIWGTFLFNLVLVVLLLVELLFDLYLPFSFMLPPRYISPFSHTKPYCFCQEDTAFSSSPGFLDFSQCGWTSRVAGVQVLCILEISHLGADDVKMYVSHLILWLISRSLKYHACCAEVLDLGLLSLSTWIDLFLMYSSNVCLQ